MPLCAPVPLAVIKTMNIQQAILKVTGFGISLVLSLYTLFRLAWAQSSLRLLGVAAVFVWVFSVLRLTLALTQMIAPVETHYDLVTLTEKRRSELLKRVIGPRKMAVITYTFVSLLTVIVGGSGYWLFTSISQFKQDQLSRFGQRQRVSIKKVGYVSKSRHAYFDYYLNGNQYSKSLSTHTYHEGDSATILFSTENPEIVVWE
jgi:hypothetical protein